MMDSKPNVRQWNAPEILEALKGQREKLQSMGVRKLGLFGSYVRGEQTPDSDMDFVVILDNYHFDTYMDVKIFLEDFFGSEVDLVPEDSIKPDLRPYILKEVVYVQNL
jgi:predicted nucleotidyltransferase